MKMRNFLVFSLFDVLFKTVKNESIIIDLDLIPIWPKNPVLGHFGAGRGPGTRIFMPIWLRSKCLKGPILLLLREVFGFSSSGRGGLISGFQGSKMIDLMKKKSFSMKKGGRLPSGVIFLVIFEFSLKILVSDQLFVETRQMPCFLGFLGFLGQKPENYDRNHIGLLKTTVSGRSGTVRGGSKNTKIKGFPGTAGPVQNECFELSLSCLCFLSKCLLSMQKSLTFIKVSIKLKQSLLKTYSKSSKTGKTVSFPGPRVMPVRGLPEGWVQNLWF